MLLEKDIIENTNKKLVDEVNKDLEGLGYSPQIFCRDINFFYLDESLRSRIEKNGDKYNVLNTDLSFTEEEILKLVDEYPERFSPNVILSSFISGNYSPQSGIYGWPAEVVYWLQLKSVFDAFQSTLPVLMPRNLEW